MSNIPSGEFLNLMHSYYGPQTIAEANRLWKEFLETLGLPPGSIPETNPEIRQKYLLFLSGKLDIVVAAEGESAFSPQEVAARHIMFEAFNIVLKMLKVLQFCMKTQSQMLSFYAKWQKEYVNMMRKLPMYGPEIMARIIANSTDFGDTKLGYGGTTVRDVLESLVRDIKSEEPQPPLFTTRLAIFNHGQDYMVTEHPTLNPYIVRFELSEQLDASQNPTGQYRFSIFVNTDPLTAGTYADTPILQVDLAANPALTGQARERDLCERLLALCTQQWNAGTFDPSNTALLDIKVKWGTATVSDALMKNDPIYSLIWGPWNTPAPGAWPDAFSYGASDEDKKTATSFRSELNSRLQLYLENARSLKERIADTSKRTESLESQIKESMQSQSNLLSSMTESLRGLLSAIFR